MDAKGSLAVFQLDGTTLVLGGCSSHPSRSKNTHTHTSQIPRAMWCGPCVYAGHKIQTHTSPTLNSLKDSRHPYYSRDSRGSILISVMQTTPRDLLTKMSFLFMFPILPLSLVTNRSGPGLQMFLCKHYRAGKGQHHLPGVHGCTNVKLGQRSSSAWQTENNEFGNLKNNFTSSTREQTFLGILMFLGLIYIYISI